MSPVGPGMAAVIATMRGSDFARSTMVFANASVYPVGTDFEGPVAGLKTGASCKCFSSSSSAGE